MSVMSMCTHSRQVLVNPEQSRQFYCSQDNGQIRKSLISFKALVYI